MRAPSRGGVFVHEDIPYACKFIPTGDEIVTSTHRSVFDITREELQALLAKWNVRDAGIWVWRVLDEGEALDPY